MLAVLISTYELGHQPFGLSSPAAWLTAAGAEVRCMDLALTRLDEETISAADLIAFYLPMHTATRIATGLIERVRKLNPQARVAAYGLYAPMNAGLLRSLGVQYVIGGEFEDQLVNLLGPHHTGADSSKERVSLAKLRFMVPDRSSLPPLDQYAFLTMPEGSRKTVGYTEASRGCKHLCRHCPVVPVYGGRFRIVQRDVVLEDIGQQVRSGAQHITFGDPDFFNGIGHAIDIVEALHQEFNGITYDVTVKIEHLLKFRDRLPLLRDTGCAFVTTAVESLDDRVLEILNKGHTRADFIEVVHTSRKIGLPVVPTFVTFTPWLTLESYRDLLWTLAELDLIEQVPSIQLAIRLLIPAGSLLLEAPEAQSIVGPFDEAALSYRWAHPDPRVDHLHRDVDSQVELMSAQGAGRGAIFEEIWRLVHQYMGRPLMPLPPRKTLWAAPPYLSEPWYCCAEPTREQLEAF
jgi:radical SAM superfamily enzyme YgiQ (UPF0313 family)